MKFLSILRDLRSNGSSDCKKTAIATETTVGHAKLRTIKRIQRNKNSRKTIEMVTIKKYGMDMLDDRLYTRRKMNRITIVSCILNFTFNSHMLRIKY